MTKEFVDIVDQRLEVRLRDRKRATYWFIALACVFIAITLDVVYGGWLSKIDVQLAEIKRPVFSRATFLTLMFFDNLGLRGLSAVFLLGTAILIGRRFKVWRPFKLSIITLLALNVCIGGVKILTGRCKSWQNFDPCVFTGGMSYPSGHASNVILTWGLLAYIILRYSHRYPEKTIRLYWLVAVFAMTMSVASLIRNTHWMTDLLGGMFLGGTILIFVVAVDRFVPFVKSPSDKS